MPMPLKEFQTVICDGIVETRMAIEVMRRVSIEERVLWFWFAPFTGLVEQSRKVLSNGVFVVTWASLAARKAESRRARQRGDAGMAIDDVIPVWTRATARAESFEPNWIRSS
ncbi:hypothetical protein AEA01_01085 [Xanthomonas campestris pv. campestris]|nr:hypothetical protein AEA01_01085 [Xanthomonas campestris pv. campestris]